MTLTKNRVVKYFFEAKEELQKVTWPTRKEVYRYTVLVFVLIFSLAVYFGVIDWAMQLGLEELLSLSTSAQETTISDIQPEVTIDPSSINVETTPAAEGTETTVTE